MLFNVNLIPLQSDGCLHTSNFQGILEILHRLWNELVLQNNQLNDYLRTCQENHEIQVSAEKQIYRDDVVIPELVAIQAPTPESALVSAGQCTTSCRTDCASIPSATAYTEAAMSCA